MNVLRQFAAADIGTNNLKNASEQKGFYNFGVARTECYYQEAIGSSLRSIAAQNVAFIHRCSPEQMKSFMTECYCSRSTARTSRLHKSFGFRGGTVALLIRIQSDSYKTCGRRALL